MSKDDKHSRIPKATTIVLPSWRCSRTACVHCTPYSSAQPLLTTAGTLIQRAPHFVFDEAHCRQTLRRWPMIMRRKWRSEVGSNRNGMVLVMRVVRMHMG